MHVRIKDFKILKIKKKLKLKTNKLNIIIQNNQIDIKKIKKNKVKKKRSQLQEKNY